MEHIPEGVLLRNFPILRVFNGSFEHKCISCVASLYIEILLFCLIGVLSNLSLTYKQLKPAQKVTWCLVGVRGLFATWSNILAVVLLSDLELWQDIAMGTTLSSQLFVAIFVGFFIYECSFLLFSDIMFEQRSYGQMTHHFLFLWLSSISLFWGQAHLIGCFTTPLHISAPFSGLGWMLIKADMSDTVIWKYNQAILIHMYHFKQNVLFAMACVLINNWMNCYNNMNTLFFVSIIGCLVLFTCLNISWICKRTQQFLTKQDLNFKPDETSYSNGCIPAFTNTTDSTSDKQD